MSYHLPRWPIRQFETVMFCQARNLSHQLWAIKTTNGCLGGLS